MINPLYNVKDLTDDQILEKLKKCYTSLENYNRLGHNSMVDSIESTIATLELEQRDRMTTNMSGEFEKINPDHLKPINIGHCESDNNE